MKTLRSARRPSLGWELQIPRHAATSDCPAAEVHRLEDDLAPLVRQIVGLLDDPRRAVRAETGRALAQLPGQLKAQLLNGNQRVKLDRAIDEYIQGILESNDRGGAHMELGVLVREPGA